MSIRMRHTSGHTRNRRSHHALTAMTIVKDKESGNLRLPHRVDEVTGMYRGKQIAPAKVKTKNADKHAKGVNTTGAPHSSASVGDHTHEHANAETNAAKGIFGKIKRATRTEAKPGGRPKARSGFGGGV